MATNWKYVQKKGEMGTLFQHLGDKVVLYKTPFHGEFVGVMKACDTALFDFDGMDSVRNIVQIQLITDGINTKHVNTIWVDFCARCTWEELESGHVCPPNIVK